MIHMTTLDLAAQRVNFHVPRGRQGGHAMEGLFGKTRQGKRLLAEPPPEMVLLPSIFPVLR